MRIRLIRKETIEDFARVNARSKPSFADNLGNSSHRVVFNWWEQLWDNLQVPVREKQAHLFICWIGPHAEYDELRDKGEQCTVTNY